MLNLNFLTSSKAEILSLHYQHIAFSRSSNIMIFINFVYYYEMNMFNIGLSFPACTKFILRYMGKTLKAQKVLSTS